MARGCARCVLETAATTHSPARDQGLPARGDVVEDAMTYFMVRAATMLVTLGLIGMSSPAQARSSRVVPTDYPTIQSAIDAAAPGDTVTVRSGTYTEQLRIRKDLEIVGAGVRTRER